MFARPQDRDRKRLPKKKIKNDLFPRAIFNSLRISPKDMDPVHFDKDCTSFFVLKDEYKTVITITIAPVMANGNHASGFN